MEQYLIPAIATIIIAIIEAIAARERKETKESRAKEEKRANQRARESRLSMDMMSATLKLSVVTANALTGGHNNGNVEESRKAAQKASDEYEAFIREITAQEINM